MDTAAEPTSALTTRRIEARLSDEDIERLDECARRAGVDRAECVGELIRRALDEGGHDARQPSFAEIVAPIHREFAESGMTEEELYQLLEEAREEVWQERQRSNRQK